MSQVEENQEIQGLAAPESLRPGAAGAAVRAEPAKLFETRRRVFMLCMAVAIIAICGALGYGISNPTRGLANIVSDPSEKMVAGTVTPTARVVLSAAVGGVVQATVAGGLEQGFVGMMACRAVANSSVMSVTIPSGAMVRVSGFSYAKNGQIYLEDPKVGWTDAIFFTCPPEVTRLERPYAVVAGVTPKAVSNSVVVVRTVIVPQVVLQTVIPTQSAPAGWNGVFYDPGSGCVTFQISGVKSIFADGRAVSGGDRVCGLNNFTVTIK